MVAITVPNADTWVRVGDQAILAAALLEARQTILPKRLVAPGPDDEQLQLILGAAASAPDHGQLRPWRFVLIPLSERGQLAEVFAAALLERDAQATSEQVAQAKEKAYRSPLLLLAVVDGERGDPEIDLHERIISAGCAIQNMLLMATALGHGSALTSGKALKSHSLRSLFALAQGEHALCFVSFGTVQSSKGAHLRPVVADYVSTLMAPRHSLNVSLPGHRAPTVGLESPFEMLVACHERVSRSLNLLQRLQQHLQDKGLDDDARQAARDVLRYFDLAAPLHHQDEELHVFPPLLAGPDSQVHAVVKRLMQDHLDMERNWARARNVLVGIAESVAVEWKPLTSAQTEALANFSALYTQHIADEESLVYPAAQSALSPASVQAMSADMVRRRAVQ